MSSLSLFASSAFSISDTLFLRYSSHVIEMVLMYFGPCHNMVLL